MMHRTKLPSRKMLIYTLTSCIWYYPMYSLKPLTWETEYISKVLFGHFVFLLFFIRLVWHCMFLSFSHAKKNWQCTAVMFANILQIFFQFSNGLCYFISFFIVVKYALHKIYHFNHFKCIVQWHYVHLQCGITITTTDFQNFLIIQNRNSVPIK